MPILVNNYEEDIISLITSSSPDGYFLNQTAGHYIRMSVYENGLLVKQYYSNKTWGGHSVYYSGGIDTTGDGFIDDWSTVYPYYLTNDISGNLNFLWDRTIMDPKFPVISFLSGKYSFMTFIIPIIFFSFPVW